MACTRQDWLDRMALILGGSTAFGLVVRLLRPHKAVKHASHRLRHHARGLRPRRERAGPAMTDAEFDAIEYALDRQSSRDAQSRSTRPIDTGGSDCYTTEAKVRSSSPARSPRRPSRRARTPSLELQGRRDRREE